MMRRESIDPAGLCAAAADASPSVRKAESVRRRAAVIGRLAYPTALLQAEQPQHFVLAGCVFGGSIGPQTADDAREAQREARLQVVGVPAETGGVHRAARDL